MGLFGDEFEITIPATAVKDIIKKANSKKAVKEENAEKILKSKSLALHEKLDIIRVNVMRILGRRKDNILVIKDKKTFDEYIDAAIKAGRIAIDTETNNSTDPVTCRLMGPCFYYPGGKQVYVPINHRDPDTKERLPWQLTEEDCREELQKIVDSKIDIIMHNGKFDYEVLKCTCGIKVIPTWDTIVCARLLNENEKASLKWQYRTKIDPTQEKYDIENLFEHIAYADVDPDIFAYYASSDAQMTDELYKYQAAELAKPEYGPHMDLTGAHEVKGLRWLFHKVEMPIVIVTAEMELKGVKVDCDFGKKLQEKYNKQLADIDIKMDKILQRLGPLIDCWKVSKDSTDKLKIYTPVKTKMTPDELEQAFPFVDEEGRRYKPGKTKIEQLKNPINLSSPTQLAILFFDILKCPTLGKGGGRGTGVNELKALLDALQDKTITNKMAKNVAACLLDTGDAENLSIAAPEKNEDEENEDDFESFDIFEGIFDDIELDATTGDEAAPAVEKFDASSRESIIAGFNELVPSISELITALLQRRSITKLLSTYVEVIPELAQHWPDGRIRFHMNSLGTDTGRYSSGGKIHYWDYEKDCAVTVSGINVQNQPSRGSGQVIRLLYKGDVKEETVTVEDTEPFIIPEITEVETAEGYKYCRDLKIGDTLIIDEQPAALLGISYNETTREYTLTV